MTPTPLKLTTIYVRPAAVDSLQPILMDCLHRETGKRLSSFEISQDELEVVRTARAAPAGLGLSEATTVLPVTGKGPFGMAALGTISFDPKIPYDAAQTTMSVFVISDDPELLAVLGLSLKQAKDVREAIRSGVVQRLQWNLKTSAWVVGNGCTTYTLNPKETP